MNKTIIMGLIACIMTGLVLWTLRALAFVLRPVPSRLARRFHPQPGPSAP